jgi:hypothetical protein
MTWGEKILNEADSYLEKGQPSMKLPAVLTDWIDAILDHAKRFNSVHFFDYLKYHDMGRQLEQGAEALATV